VSPRGMLRSPAMSRRRRAAAGENPAGEPLPRNEWRLLGAILFLAAALRLWLASRNAGLTMDSPLYMEMARALARGEPAVGPAHHGYSAIVALVGTLVPGRLLPGRVVSFVAGLVVVALGYFLIRRSVSPPWAGLTAGLLAFHPLLAVYSGPAMTETTYLAFLVAALLLADRGRLFLGGVLLGLGYAIRPEALVAAAGVAALTRGGWRGALLMLAGFALVAAPYVGYLSHERGEFTLTPKSALVRPPETQPRQAEWRIGDARRPVREPHRTLIERFRWAMPGMAKHYLPHLAGHARRLLEAWPWPLMALSALGLVIRRGPEAGTLVHLFVLPLLAVGPDIRFAMLFLPALAVSAAAAVAWGTARWSRSEGVITAAGIGLAIAGIAWSWTGPPGRHALRFDDGPMPQMREAGEWLQRNGRQGAIVMDRKAYVPFFAGMRHVQLPDDDYETIIEYARTSGVDYLVLEEYVAEGLRRQLLPLIADARFRAGEHRLRTIYHIRSGPHTGVAIMEVLH